MKNSLFNILYKIVTTLYPLVAVTYVSHILEADKIGMVSYAQNVVSYFVILSALGLPTYGIKQTAKVSQDKNKRSNLFFELITLNGVTTTISLVIYIILVLTVQSFVDNALLYFVAGIQILLNYINVDWFYQGIEDYKYISIRNIIVKLIALIALPLYIHDKSDYIIYALIYCLAIAGNNIFNILRLSRFISKPKESLQISKHIKNIFILSVVSIAVEIYVMIDTTMLGFFYDDAIVGCYANAMKLTRMVSTTIAAIGAVLFPRLTVVFEKGKQEEFNKIVNMGIKIMLIFAIPASIGLILLREEIIYVLFGPTFADAIPILGVLALMVPVIVCNTLMGGQVLVTMNLEKKYVISVVTAAIVNVVLNAIFIPRCGATSAAATSLISECITLVLYTYFSRKYVKLDISVKYVISIVVPLGVYVLLYYGLINRLCVNNVVMVLTNVMLCIVTYFGLGILMKNQTMLFLYDKLYHYLLKK